MNGTLYYYFTNYYIKVNGVKLKDVSDGGRGAKSRMIKLAKEMDQNQNIEVYKIKWYMGASYVGECVNKEVVWSNQN